MVWMILDGVHCRKAFCSAYKNWYSFDKYMLSKGYRSFFSLQPMSLNVFHLPTLLFDRHWVWSSTAMLSFLNRGPYSAKPTLWTKNSQSLSWIWFFSRFRDSEGVDAITIDTLNVDQPIIHVHGLNFGLTIHWHWTTQLGQMFQQCLWFYYSIQWSQTSGLHTWYLYLHGELMGKNKSFFDGFAQ